MTTIAAGQVAGLTRATALEFSFFLSIPTMAAATGYDLLKTVLHKHNEAAAGVAEQAGGLHLGGHGWALLLVGLVVSFIVALAVIAWFMAWVRKRGFVPFAIYRLAAGAAVIALAAKFK